MPSNHAKSSTSLKQLKFITIGDGYIGKTSVLTTYTEARFPTHHVPTIFENTIVSALWSPPQDKKRSSKRDSGKCVPVCMSLVDSAGQEEWSALRVLSYPGTDCFLLCYSVVNRTSFENLEHKWIPEIRKYGGENCRFLLIGTKVDLREDAATMRELRENGEQAVTTEEGEQLAKRIRAPQCCGFIETSAYNFYNIKEAFYMAIDAVLRPEYEKELKNKKKVCSIM